MSCLSNTIATREPYQLSCHPIGSKREFWSLSWPLMIGLLSSTLMLFVDRLFLARWDPLALNAAVSAGMAYFMFLLIPMGVVEIAEVLVGRLHGEERNKEIGSAAWQMVLVSLGLLPIFILISLTMPQMLFWGSSNSIFETEYFTTLIPFGAFQCIAIALCGFFIGIGNVKIVTFSAITGNVINIVLDYWMIFGGGPMPELGITGAALATGISLIVQILFLLLVYWSRHNRNTYGTSCLSLNRVFCVEGLRIGLPSGAGRSMELLAHFLFFRIVMTVGAEQMALAAIAQSLYILASFVVDAQGKTASAIVSNLLGADQHKPLSQVLRSGYIIHTIFALLFLLLTYTFSEQIFILFCGEGGNTCLQMTPELMVTFERVLILLSIFFLLDGFYWIMMGFLTAAKDTRFIFWICLLVNWLAYIPPTIWFVGLNKGGADVAWAIIVGVSSLSLLIFLWRYYSGRWLMYNHDNVVL